MQPTVARLLTCMAPMRMLRGMRDEGEHSAPLDRYLLICILLERRYSMAQDFYMYQTLTSNAVGHA